MAGRGRFITTKGETINISRGDVLITDANGERREYHLANSAESPVAYDMAKRHLTLCVLRITRNEPGKPYFREVENETLSFSIEKDGFDIRQHMLIQFLVAEAPRLVNAVNKTPPTILVRDPEKGPLDYSNVPNPKLVEARQALEAFCSRYHLNAEALLKGATVDEAYAAQALGISLKGAKKAKKKAKDRREEQQAKSSA